MPPKSPQGLRQEARRSSVGRRFFPTNDRKVVGGDTSLNPEISICPIVDCPSVKDVADTRRAYLACLFCTRSPTGIGYTDAFSTCNWRIARILGDLEHCRAGACLCERERDALVLSVEHIDTIEEG